MPDHRPIRYISPSMLEVLGAMRPFDDASLLALRAFGENFDPDQIVNIAVSPTQVFDTTSRGCRYHFKSHDGVRVEIIRISGGNSCVRIDLNVGRVLKVMADGDPWQCLQREWGWLGRVGSDVAPRTLRYAAGALELNYVGEPVNRYNLPADWRDQAEGLLQGLAAAGCAHNDISYSNLVVANGRIKLIDFGWATSIGEPIPGNWPEILGHDHRLGIHDFDDRHALFAALGAIERQALEA